MHKKTAERWSPWILLGAIVVLWQIICSAFNVSEFIFPSPWAIGTQLVEFGGVIAAHAWRTFWVTMVGFGIAGTGFGVILAVIGRASSDENRSLALGIATAAGSAGQVFGAPLAEGLLAFYPWQTVFIIFGVIVLSCLFFLPMLGDTKPASKSELDESMGTVLKRAFTDPSYLMIFVGFFSCGYQLGFITAHFPAMITEMCGPISPMGTLASLGITTTSALPVRSARASRPR